MIMMSKFNQKTPDLFGRAGAGAGGSSPIVVDRRASARTFEGAPSFARSDRGQLFLTSTAGFIAEDKFYETGDATVNRVRELAATIATEAEPLQHLSGAMTGRVRMPDRIANPRVDTGLEWLLPFVTWLRRKGNMRTAPIVIACEAVHARLAKGIHGGNRELLRAALLRADEPGEMISYWRSRFGRAIPSCVKRGIGDTVPKLYTEYSALKYDTSAHGVRFGDVLDICHWTHGAGEELPDVQLYRNTLHTWLLDRRHNRADALDDLNGALPMVAARARLESIPVADRRALVGSAHLDTWMREAGVTWEWLSGWLSDGQGMTAEAWETVIPQMGYMALLRNLANFDKAGVSDSVAATVAARLADPDQVARSKQFPFRFLSAYRMAASSLRWGHALNTALTLSTGNIPELDGRTLILVDTSGSMSSPMSGKSQVSCVDAAALFGVALAFRNWGRVDLAGWATSTYTHTIRPGAALIEQVQRFTNRAGSVGHGTDLAQALRMTFERGEHTRVFVFSDMQLMGNGWRGGTDAVNRYVPDEVPVYSFNLAGYAGAMTAGTNRHELGGLTDATFRLIPVIEAAQTGQWPWEMDAA